MAKHARKRGVKYYQVDSLVVNPITIQELLKIIFEHFKCNPYFDRKGNTIKLLKQLTCVNTRENYGQAYNDTVFLTLNFDEYDI